MIKRTKLKKKRMLTASYPLTTLGPYLMLKRKKKKKKLLRVLTMVSQNSHLAQEKSPQSHI